jgi:hypothetical protein
MGDGVSQLPCPNGVDVNGIGLGNPLPRKSSLKEVQVGILTLRSLISDSRS